MKRGQGTFEYVLLLGGVLLIVVLAVVLLRGGLFQSSSKSVFNSNCKLSLAKAGFYDRSTVSACANSGATCTDAAGMSQCGSTSLSQVAANIGKNIPMECTSFNSNFDPDLVTCDNGR